MCPLGLTGVGVVKILEAEEDQLAGVLGEPDAVGVLVFIKGLNVYYLNRRKRQRDGSPKWLVNTDALKERIE